MTQANLVIDIDWPVPMQDPQEVGHRISEVLDGTAYRDAQSQRLRCSQ